MFFITTIFRGIANYADDFILTLFSSFNTIVVICSGCNFLFSLQVEGVGSNSGKTSAKVVVVDCGQL